ncbi:MAG TPA: ATP-binding protein, partial [Pyrinomonadaceae bacterium]
MVIFAALLQNFGYSINLTVVVVVALVAVSWWGGRGPGILFSSLVFVVTALKNPPDPNQSTTVNLFGHMSVYALLLFITVLVSSRKSFERILRDQTDLLSITLASIGDAVITTDADGFIRYINPTAERLVECTSAEARGKSLGEIFKVFEEDSGTAIENIFDKIKSGRKVVRLETNVKLIGCSGASVPIINTAAAIVDSSGNFRGAIVVFQDISGRRATEDALVSSQTRTQQSQKLEAIGTLTGGIAHDFNNLLTAILGFAQLSLRKLATRDAIYENIVKIEKSANRGSELTQKLLAFSRRQHLDRRVIDLNDSISEILKLLERVLGENIKVSFLPSPRLEAVSADPAQIEQIIMNLSVNARDAMPKGGRLMIETRNLELDDYYCRQHPECIPGKYVQILVSDTGSGIDAEILSKIFEPFFTTKEVNKGTGLGLSMVYGIVKQHDGNINVYSEVGRGTTFKILLPVVDAEISDDIHITQPTLLGGNETILVAEDEESLRQLCHEVLTALGYNVMI